jgi:glycosyltransferase involved in cell wall biosynthesis
MDNVVPRNIVVSAVNLRKGGTLTVLQDCLRYLSGRKDLHVTALVHKRELCDFPGIHYMEIPWSLGSWVKRLWCEYVTMRRISKTLPETDLWFSLHDTTPRVKARRQAVYCHTSFPFMKIRWQDFRMDAKIPLFALLTQYAYRAFSRRNAFLVVQSVWMREALSRLIGFDKKRMVVAPPSFRPMEISGMTEEGPEMTTFFYPSTPDCHKNFEVLCEAARLLEQRIGKGRFRVVITVRGDENRYARWLQKHWGNVDSVEFRGLLSREELAEAYGEATCLVFPSRAETWGLPISEFLPTGKPMILADLPYAHETAAGASQVAFFPVMDAAALSGRMQEVMEGTLSSFGPVEAVEIAPPCAQDWEALFNLLLL